jgi:hypothetical protein
VAKKEVSKPKPSIFPRKADDGKIPTWFYMSSIFAAFLFLIYISIFATLHFESIEHMNITIIFLFIAMVSYFLISAIYMVSENKKTACNTSDNILCGHCFHYDLCIQGN